MSDEGELRIRSVLPFQGEPRARLASRILRGGRGSSRILNEVDEVSQALVEAEYGDVQLRAGPKIGLFLERRASGSCGVTDGDGWGDAEGNESLEAIGGANGVDGHEA